MANLEFAAIKPLIAVRVCIARNICDSLSHYAFELQAALHSHNKRIC